MPPAAPLSQDRTPPAPAPAVFDLARELARMLAAQQFAADQRKEPGR